jgi:hypothetical protein
MQSLAEQGLEQLARLPFEQREAVIAAYRHAISMTFFTGACITLAAFAFVLFLPEHPLKTYPETRVPVRRENGNP